MSSSQETTTRICLACGLETQDSISTCPKDGSLLTSGTDPLVGTTFMEKYFLTEVLGRGGMSAVYKAKHLMMDRFVAIKFLRSELVHDNVMLQRFQLESKAVSMLKHPNIITVHDFGLSTAGVPYLIMDYLEGKTLSDVIGEIDYMEPARCVVLFGQICNALAHTHSKGVIHRDIKPSNLMISIGDDGQEISQVVDFGIAKLLERESGDFAKLTASGEVFGSPAFMSPEQCNGSTIDARTDIYALGCVLYNSLTGRPPLLGKNAMETVLMHVRDMPRPFGEVRPDLSISPVLERVVFKALAKDPDHRFNTMAEFGAELGKSLHNNNTTWSLPRATGQNLPAATNYEHTMPVKTASDTVSPAAASPEAYQTRSQRPAAIEPTFDLANAGNAAAASLSKESSAAPPAPNTVSSETRDSRKAGGMNPDSMIVPGSDLFGYESLRPALPDQGSPTQPTQPAQPRKAEEPIPLVAPARVHVPATVNPPARINEPAINDRGQIQHVTVEKAPKANFQKANTSGGPNKNIVIIAIAAGSVLLIGVALLMWQLPNFIDPTYSASEIFKNSSRSVVKLKLLSKARKVEFAKYNLTDKDDNPIYAVVDDDSNASLYQKGKKVSSVDGRLHVGSAALPVTVKLNALMHHNDTP